jgi:predicted transcriptional regulator
MQKNALLLSIRPLHAEKILDGTKTVELRRVLPRVGKGDVVLIYASSPVKALVGAFTVDKVVTDRPRELWEIVQGKAGITRKEFNAYYAGASEGHGIFFSDVLSLHKPLSLETIRLEWPGFQPPQGYYYLTKEKKYSRLSSKLAKRL